ncbi:MAG: hypothetical protein PHU35_05685, partial [Bacteroidales bacterium]|nr:hypothetical protein [Bacteroidales bacterium]
MKKLIIIILFFVSALTYAEETKVTSNSSPTNEQTINLLEKKINLLEESVKDYKDKVSCMISWIGGLATIYALSGIFIPILLTKRREKNVDEQIEEVNNQIKEVGEREKSLNDQIKIFNSKLDKFDKQIIYLGEKVKKIEETETIVKEVQDIVTNAEQEAKASAKESLINKLFTEALNEKYYLKAIDIYSQIIELD